MPGLSIRCHFLLCRLFCGGIHISPPRTLLIAGASLGYRATGWSGVSLIPTVRCCDLDSSACKCVRLLSIVSSRNSVRIREAVARTTPIHTASYSSLGLGEELSLELAAAHQSGVDIYLHIAETEHCSILFVRGVVRLVSVENREFLRRRVAGRVGSGRRISAILALRNTQVL